MKKILICVGTRPNFIKVTRFKNLALKYNLEIKLLHTGQHFDHLMIKVFFDELGLDKPDIYLNALVNSQIVITDSGGIQEETYFLQIPCLTVRENTERPITISMGSNELIKLNSKLIHHKMIDKLQSNKKGSIPPLWDGFATERIMEVLSK